MISPITDKTQDQFVKLQSFLDKAIERWNLENPKPKSWYEKNKVYLVKTTTFLISTTDNLINFVETFIPKGTDKKLAVIAIISQLFDYIASKAFPIWVVPFIPVIKHIVISIVISNLIEFIVSKYRDGSWKWEKKPDVSTSV